MAVSLKHSKTAIGDDNPDRQVSVSHWNAEHTLTGTANTVLGFDTNGAATETTIVGSYAASVATRTALAALSSSQAAVNLRESGRDGLFVWDSSDLSALVAADTQQGLYVPPSSDTTGASGAWVRKFAGPADLRWFGAVADCVAVGSGTTNTAIFDAAITALVAAGRGWLHIPKQASAYRFATSPAAIHDRIMITGEGHSQNPGQVGATTYTGVAAWNGTVLCFDADTAGFTFHAYTDNNANATAYEFQSAYKSSVKDILLYGGSGTGITAHGIYTRTTVDISNVKILNFAGCGLKIEGYDSGASPYGSFDSGHIDKLSCRSNFLHGVHVKGNDVNVNTFTTLDVANNGGCGVLDQGALGNTYIAPHASGNNSSHPSGSNTGSAAQRTQVLADCADLATLQIGSYVTDSAVGAHVFVGGYSESGNGSAYKLVTPTIVVGGVIGSNTTAMIGTGSTAHLYGFGILRGQGSSGALDIIGRGDYGNIKLYGTNNLPTDGLDLLTGLDAAYYGCNQHWFRNNAGSTNYFSHTGSNLNIITGGLQVNSTQILNSSGVLQAAGFPALTGDVTTSAGSLATTIGNGKVTLAKIANASANSKLLGSGAAGSGSSYSEITLGTGLSMSGTTLSAAAAQWIELLYYDFGASGAASTKECDVTGYKEILLVGYQLTTANSVQRAIQFSTDGGSTWYTTSGDYQDVATTGQPANNAAIFPHTTAVTSARDFTAHVIGNNGRIPVPVFLLTRLVHQQFKASATAINRVRLMGSSGGSGTPDAGNFTGGTFAVYGR